MFKKTVEFEDYSENGEKKSVTLHFNLSKAEVAEMEMNESQMASDGGITGGLEEKLSIISKGGKGSEILKAFKDIVFMAYGRKVQDPELGTIFDKSADISRRFERSAAYNEFFMWLIGDEGHAAEFVKYALPKEWRDQSPSDQPSANRRPVAPVQEQAPTPAPQTEEHVQGRQPTQEELEEFWKNQNKK